MKIGRRRKNISEKNLFKEVLIVIKEIALLWKNFNYSKYKSDVKLHVKILEAFLFGAR